MKNNWARSAVRTLIPVKTEKTRSTSHTIIGALQYSNVIHVVMKKLSPKKQNGPKIQTSKAVNPEKEESSQEAKNEGENEAPQVDE
ncbi:MAG: hypothetical protein EXX96DRAFT_648209 [Benjaminiella poitrasii]|nr:MAG: hypothetical protein EXX96DRAFT_648209 [Benjaminiella poitrasii]